MDTAYSDTTYSHTSFASASVRRLTAEDFQVDTPLKISIKDSACNVILFYVENKNSYDAIKVFASVAETAIGPRYAACNVALNERVGNAFASVSSDTSHPFHSFGLRQWPTVIAYRNGSPVNVYNGSYDNKSLGGWAMTMACQGKFRESVQVGAGVEFDTDVSAPTPSPYVDLPNSTPVVKQSSVDFTPDKPVRTYSGGPGISPGPQPGNRQGRVLPSNPTPQT